MMKVRDVAFNTSLIQGMWWEGLFKKHLGRKGFLFSHCHEGSLIWRKHTRITMRQEKTEVTTQPHGYKQEFCRIIAFFHAATVIQWLFTSSKRQVHPTFLSL